MRNILISGYYGFQNSGDDALLLAIAQDLRQYCPELSLTVLSANPKKTAADYGIAAVNRMNPFALLRALSRCDLLLSGGGTLIQDRTSTQSLLYYLTIIRLAGLFGKKVMLYSNGIGPLQEKHRAITRHVLNRVQLITLRDPASEAELVRIGVDRPAIYLTADPAFSLEPACPEQGRRLLSSCGLSPDKTTICLSVRPWKELPQDFESILATAADELCRRYDAQCVLLPMQPQKDTELCRKIAEKMQSPCALLPPVGIRETLAVIGACSLCIGMRLHSLIYAVSRGVPVVGLVYDPKISGVMDYMEKKDYLPLSALSVQALCELASPLLSGEKDPRSEQVLSSLRQKAKDNAAYAISLLNEQEGRR